MNVITVTQLNTYLKSIIDSDLNLKNIFVVGEISNFKHYFKSGHMYFTLKDDTSQLKAVMFSSNAVRLRFKPEDGMRVICRGRVSVYERDGAYQLYAEDIQPDGVGALALAFEQLKDKLFKEGLFDAEYKKPLPKYPKKIGIATSNMGAAIEDIKNITKRRYPLAELVIAPTVVQGTQAPESIVNSLRLLDSIDDIDVIIVGRGGGSLEDLWAFNTEEVARAVFACSKPVISAVGHETDITICDFVADFRAETPSAAAENAVPDIFVLNDNLFSIKKKIETLVLNRIDYENQRLDFIQNESVLSDFDEVITGYSDVIDTLNNELKDAMTGIINECTHKLSNTASTLQALSPLAVLSRGFSIASDSNDNVIKSASQLSDNDEISVKFSNGVAKCTVNEVVINNG